jgi:hypothetical protein
MIKLWLYRLLITLDGYWHAYVCNLVEKYADERFDGDEPR